MARYRRYRRTIVRAPKRKWGSNIASFNSVTTGNPASQFASFKLVGNSAQSSNPTPVILKVGNFKIQGDVFVTPGAASSKTAVSIYIIYIPEGITLSSADNARGLVIAHPEWVMAWKFINSNVSTGTANENGESFTFSSRLKRNLNSGDSIHLLCLAESDNLNSAVFTGMAQFWTCAN